VCKANWKQQDIWRTVHFQDGFSRDEGALDGSESSVEKLAERLGIGDGELRRLSLQHLSASPISVAQTRRVLLAKQLIHDTKMPMSEIATAAGFGSLRRFSEIFLDLFGSK
jgi:AraC family transcriptional regulator, regulatory protein of adaptative response / DNA-3-methyladenine glycosylase II